MFVIVWYIVYYSIYPTDWISTDNGDIRRADHPFDWAPSTNVRLRAGRIAVT